jgi:hypothetical protein
MKTIKTLFASLAFLFLGLVPISAMGQSMPYTFTANTAAKASEVNANFEYLLKRFKLRTTTINCYSDSIQDALKEYNHIKVSGNCNQYIQIGLRGYQSSSQQQINRDFIFIEGLDPNKATTISSSNLVVVDIDDTVTVHLKNLTISGTNQYALVVGRGATLYAESLEVKNAQNGITVHDGGIAYLSDITVSSTSNAVTVTRNGTARIYNNSLLQNSPVGLAVYYGSHAQVDNSTIKGNQLGVYMKQASLDVYGSTISNNTDDGFLIHQNSSAEINNSNILNNTRDGLTLRNGSQALVVNSVIDGSQSHGVYINANSVMQTDNLTVKNSNHKNISLSDNSVLRFFSSTVESDNETNLEINTGSRVIAKGSNMNFSGSSAVKLYDRATLEVRSTSNSFSGTIACSNPANMGVSIVRNQTGSSWDNSSSPTTCPVH